MRIQLIEPKKSSKTEKKRVCAYARVSTDSRKQGESLENQISSYERSIKANPEYEFAGVYADQGISGYSRNRPEFQKMIQKVKNGEIDLIITKAISRFARNTAVLLEVVRELRQLGIAIYFETEEIDTDKMDSRLMISVIESFAQAENESRSDNIKWGNKQRAANGTSKLYDRKCYGYTNDEDGKLNIVEEEAKVVRLIFN